ACGGRSYVKQERDGAWYVVCPDQFATPARGRESSPAGCGLPPGRAGSDPPAMWPADRTFSGCFHFGTVTRVAAPPGSGLGVARRWPLRPDVAGDVSLLGRAQDHQSGPLLVHPVVGLHHL